MEYLAKKSFSFLQDCAFTSINNQTCTNKWHISRKSRFLFCKIVHLLVLIINHILINGISREKVVFFNLFFTGILFCKKNRLLVLVKFFTNFAKM